MICPKCGGETVTIDNVCVMCGTYLTQFVLPCEIKTSIFSLEKIEPLSGIIIESRWSPPSTSELTAKLNEVIKKVNLMMEVMNKGVTK